jgi:uncharacterized RDD family membrane protein YckC
VSCPACGAPLVAGQDRCGGCGTLVGAPVEGALAPNPAPLRELPSLRRREREKTWKDEVRERVRHRRQEKSLGPAEKRVDAELPLFKDEAPGTEPRPAAPEAPVAPAMELGPPPDEAPQADPYALTERIPEAVDLPLNIHLAAPAATHSDPGLPHAERDVAWTTAREPREGWSLDDAPEAPGLPPERPALVAERVRAAAVDLLFLGTLWAVVVYFAYFAGRPASAGAAQLVRTWPWLLGYLAFLGLAYAAYFTGTTGQTLGKILGELRVVDTAGRPPGYPRAFVRAALGCLGLLLAGLGGLAMFLDPARRGLHDKLLGTRVIRR